jgi:MOSC domain-containing protein YiiM
MKNGFLSAVCRSPAKGTQKTSIGEATLIEGMGMEGDGHFGFGHRQVSILSAEEAEKMKSKVHDIKPGAFAENLLIRDFDLTSLKIGDRLHVGQTLLEVTQIGKECHDRCAIYKAAGDCIMPRLGIFCSVIKGGKIKVGDIVHV